MNAFPTLTGMENAQPADERGIVTTRSRSPKWLQAHEKVAGRLCRIANRYHSPPRPISAGRAAAVFTFGLSGGYDAGVLVSNVENGQPSGQYRRQ
jgi:O-acetylhomoserine/O-acetylserine sulfhydrylase-like pyridoxal-dependent enzyme